MREVGGPTQQSMTVVMICAMTPPFCFGRQDADIHWRDLDEKYHFSCQFTADLIAMNVRTDSLAPYHPLEARLHKSAYVSQH